MSYIAVKRRPEGRLLILRRSAEDVVTDAGRIWQGVGETTSPSIDCRGSAGAYVDDDPVALHDCYAGLIGRLPSVRIWQSNILMKPLRYPCGPIAHHLWEDELS